MDKNYDCTLKFGNLSCDSVGGILIANETLFIN